MTSTLTIPSTNTLTATKPGHADEHTDNSTDKYTDKQPQSQGTMTVGRVSLRRIQRQWPQNPDSQLTNTLTNTDKCTDL